MRRQYVELAQTPKNICANFVTRDGKQCCLGIMFKHIKGQFKGFQLDTDKQLKPCKIEGCDYWRRIAK
jgi:hypothetical protein